MKLAPLLLCAWLAATAIAVVITASADAKRPPRAAQILERQFVGNWICPDRAPPGRGPVVAWWICARP